MSNAVERSYAVQVRIEETIKELVPGKAGLLSVDTKVDRTKREVVALTVTAPDQETAIRKAIRLLSTELPPDTVAG